MGAIPRNTGTRISSATADGRGPLDARRTDPLPVQVAIVPECGRESLEEGEGAGESDTSCGISGGKSRLLRFFRIGSTDQRYFGLMGVLGGCHVQEQVQRRTDRRGVEAGQAGCAGEGRAPGLGVSTATINRWISKCGGLGGHEAEEDPGNGGGDPAAETDLRESLAQLQVSRV